MKIIQVKAFEYNELDEQSKISARHWLDEDPFEYETEDEEGNIVKELEYFSDMTDTDIDEHCQTNDYLFTKHGKPIHHLEEGGVWNNEN